MKPTKSFIGSAVVSAVLKNLAWLNVASGVLIVVLIAIGHSKISIFPDITLTAKLAWIFGTVFSVGLTSSLIFAAAYGLEIARDTNYRMGMSMQIAATTLGMAQAANRPTPVPPAQGATHSPYFMQPQAPQPGQPLQ